MGVQGSKTTGDAASGVPHSAAEQPDVSSGADSISGLPKPEGGAGSHELVVDSSDPVVLQQHLARARERLTFYESFDRIIGENIRRSGELMLETITLREEAQERERQAAQVEAERATARAAEQKHYRDLFGTLVQEVERAEVGLSSLRARLSAALDSIVAPNLTESMVSPQPDNSSVIQNSEPAINVPTTTPEPLPESPATDSVVVPAQADRNLEVADSEPPFAAPADVAADSDAAARTLDILIQGVPRAAVALSLQRYLNGLEGMSNVETREFAQGILRLTVTTTGPQGLTAAELANWSGEGTLRVRNETPNAVELTLE